MIPRRSTKRFRALLLSALFAVVFATLPSVRLTPRAHAQAPGKKPITHEAMWLMKRVGAPVPSPDGKWVVFSLVEPSYDESAQVTDLWVVPSDGSAKPRRLTATKGGEGGAAWSPDSRRLAFSARREGDEAAQVYVLDVADGGEAVRVTNVSMGARAPQWRPDGRALLFTSNLYIGAADEEANKKIAAERKAQKFRARAYDSFPIRRWDKWLEDTKPHIFVQSVEQGARPVDLLANTNLIREPGFAGRETNAGEELDAVWSPDGESVVFNASTKANTAAYAFYGTHLFQVSARGGSQPVQITNGAAEYAQPAFSPDGRSLYSLTTSQAGKVYYLSRLAKFNWPSPGQPVILTSTFDRAVSNFAVSPDSKTVYLTAEDAGLEKLYTVPASGGEVRLAFDMTRGTYTNLRSPARAPSTVLVANWESATNPAELVRIDPRSNTHRALTDFNAQAASQIDWQPLRHFWFTSRGGKRVHSMIALPPNFDENRRYPLLVLMHGGPHTMWRDQYFLRWNYHLLARPGYVVLLTNYTGSTGFGEKFAQD
ncbi:MAG TPA: hypothetical protein VGV38_09710, partial [Pyrinomonadaceae bacterium]|nr:hypothetical protein [Pyrinomonadaceae bacterium]